MKHMRYQLEKYKGKSSRHECPMCHDRYSLTLYVDENGIALNPMVGRCNHESGCGYHYTPKQYYADNPCLQHNYKPFIKKHQEIPKKVLHTIHFSYVERSASYNSNLLFFLRTLVDHNILDCPTIDRLMETYAIGATKDKSIIFWQIDINGRVRTGKIMQYNPETGHRIKSGGGVNWIHAIMKKKALLPDDWELTQCLFGEHLLSPRIEENKDKIVALVEAEKTALIGSMVYPQYLWLATGGKSQLSIEKLKVLKGRTVIMFPDVDGYAEWTAKAKELSFAKVLVSNVLEKYALKEDRESKIDIADCLIKALQANNLDDMHDGFAESAKLLNKLIEQNPNLKILIETLDLVLV